MTKRCFAFGCSFTNWLYWPTWADFIGINFDEYYNFGRLGSSNRFIHNRFIEANSFYAFNSHDLILIGITNCGRFNWLEDDRGKISWTSYGGPESWPETEKCNFLKQHFWKQSYGVYDTWLMVENIASFCKASKINYKIIMAMDNKHFLNQKIFQLRIKEMQMAEQIYSHCLTDLSLQVFSKDITSHPVSPVHYNYVQTFMPDYLTDKSKDFLTIANNNLDYSGSQEQLIQYINLRSEYIDILAKNAMSPYGKYH